MTLRLKHDKGWFAAGVEVENALKILTDGAFKLFIHLCLVTPRQTGILKTSQSELARTLHKSNGTIRKHLAEMEEQGICRLSGSAPFLYCRGRIEITDDYWPYQRKPAPRQNRTIDDESLNQVRRLLEERSCVVASFSTADEILARKWLQQGLSIQRIEQAILLGCARKYVDWRNHHDSTPINSLRYFEPILEEIDRLTVSDDYWVYVRSRMKRMEEPWRNRHRQVPETTQTVFNSSAPNLGDL